jgi:hypothetical protein
MKKATMVRSRRIGIGAAALMLVLFLATGGVAGAAAPSPAVTAAVGSATGPPSVAFTNFPIGDVGYSMKEFFLAGNASSYHNNAAGALPSNGIWDVGADPPATMKAYKTRAFVFKPTNPANFNGTVYLEWLNVSGGIDAGADWIVDHVEMIRQGAIYIGLTTQFVGIYGNGQVPGVGGAINGDPAFYGPTGANLVHPGDSYSYDIFSQGGQGVRDNQALMFGPGYTLSKLIGTGESQSAGRLVTYINALQPLHHVYDGFLVHSRGAGATGLRAAGDTGLTAVGVAPMSTTLIRTDIGVPVFEFQTETDSRAPRQPDTATLHYWEVAGSAHFDLYGLGAGTVDEGESPNNAAANTLFDQMIHTQSVPPGLAPCTFGLNAGPHHWALQAALRHLDVWVRTGVQPPSLAVLATVGGTPAGALVLDGNGNATGGVRSPHLDVPIATLRGSGNSVAGGGLNFCTLFGTTTPFSDAKLLLLYPNHTAFVNAWNASVDAGVAGGWILDSDAPMLKRSAEVSLIGEHVRPVAGNSRSSSSNSSITATLDTDRFAAVGDTVVVSVATGTFAGAVGCSDSKGNVYTPGPDKNTGQGRLFTCSSTVATALGTGDVVTATYPGFSGLSVVSVNKILAYATTGALDGVSIASGSNPPVNSGDINTAHAADLLFGVVAHTSPSTFTPGSGFEVVGEVSGGSGAGQKTVSPMFKAVYSTGTYAATGTLSGSGFWQAALIGYQSP